MRFYHDLKFLCSSSVVPLYFLQEYLSRNLKLRSNHCCCFLLRTGSMGDQQNMNICHSCQNTSVAKTPPHAFSKSDSSLLPVSGNCSSVNTNPDAANFHPDCNTVYNGDYYKKYEHDEVPVKDSDNLLNVDKRSLTNSDLEVLEKRIYKNVSQELQTDDDSLGSLESNIKFFKNTVEKIFDNFYTSMRDFEHYKQRFHEILNKSKEGSIDDMEGFIKDMFDHIMQSDNSLGKISRHSIELVTELENKTHVSSCGDSATDSRKDLLETAFKNEHYLSDSTEENSFKSKKLSDLEEKFNIFILGAPPCLEINLVGRNMLSEVNISDPSPQKYTSSIASADNLRKVAAKKLELEKHMRHEYDCNMHISDRDIPVKVSFAKKNIHLNEDFSRIDSNEASKSFLSKFCSLLCRKFRRSSVV